MRDNRDHTVGAIAGATAASMLETTIAAWPLRGNAAEDGRGLRRGARLGRDKIRGGESRDLKSLFNPLRRMAVIPDSSSASAGPPLRRDSEAWRERVLLSRPRNWSKSTVYVVQAGDRRLVVKDQSQLPMWFRLTFGRWLMRREAEALRRLLPVAGVPSFAGWMDKDAFATAYVEAVPLSRIEDRRPPDAYFDQLARLLHQVHALGVAHGDSHHNNVLLDAHGRPYLVDFAIAQFADGSLVGRWLYRQAVLVDRRNVAKLKYKYGPHLLTEDDRIRLAAPRLHRVVRAFVHSLRRCLKGIRKN